MGVSFAIPIDVAMNAVQQLKTSGRVSRGQIGVQVQQIDSETARGLNMPDTRGALVADVLAGSPAEKAGIQRMDVIRAIGGANIDQSSDLPPIIGAMAPGTRAKLSLLRDGKPREVTVTLSQLDEGAVAAATMPGGRGPSSDSSNPLGLVGQDLDADDRRQAGLKPGEGVGIARVEGLAAREAGLQPGDVILSVGRTPVASAAALDRALRATSAGQTIMLLVRRGNGSQFIAVTPRASGENE
jgi:serine protease Do